MRAPSLDLTHPSSRRIKFKARTLLDVTSSRATCIVVRAGPRRRTQNNNNKTNPGIPKRPESGFFADTDPNATVYPVRSSLQTDPTKRGGRWQSDFIWNSNWKDALDFEESVRKQVEQGRKEAADAANQPGADGKGFLSLTSKVDLNSMDVDLSSQLKPREKKKRVAPTANGANGQARRLSGAAAGAGYPTVPATRGEVRTWDRSGRYSRKVVPTPSLPAEAEEAAAKLAAETARYEELKKEIQLWATGLTAVSFAATFAFYGRDVAASYGVGALGGLFYLRLLSRSVDGFGVGGIGAALGQNRLLIPVILALGYNRYNLFLADSTGLTLQLLPMLVGFFTYKGAVIARQSLALFGELSAPYTSVESEDGSESERHGDSSGEGDGKKGGVDVLSVDRAFNKKMLSG